MSSEPERTPQEKIDHITSILGSDGMFGGVSKMIQQLSQLAEKGEQLKRSSHSESDSDSKKMAGSFDYSVRFGSLKREESHAVKPEPTTPKASAVPITRSNAPSEARQAEVELFEEEDHLLILAEMPGVPTEGVELIFGENELQIHGKGRVSSFTKTLTLPSSFSEKDASITSNNGIVEIRLRMLKESS